jgi:hypothetical protein
VGLAKSRERESLGDVLADRFAFAMAVSAGFTAPMLGKSSYPPRTGYHLVRLAVDISTGVAGSVPNRVRLGVRSGEWDVHPSASSCQDVVFSHRCG